MTTRIEVLVIPDCPHQTPATELIATALASTGVSANVTITTITTHDQAQRRGFTGSPTILLNGSDPFATPDSPAALTCRLYPTPDGLRGVPDLRHLCQALTQTSAG